MVRKLCAELKFSKCRSKVTVKVTCTKYMVPSERSIIRNIHVHAKYESPRLCLKVKKVISKSYVQSESFPNVGQRSRSRLCAQNLWYHRKGLVIRKTHAKYESPLSLGKKIISKPKVWQTDDGQSDPWRQR